MQNDQSDSSNRNAAMLLGGAALVVLSVLGAIDSSDDEATVAAGAAVGRFLAALAIAAFARWAYLRLTRRDGRILDLPLLVLIGGVVALLATLGIAARDEDEASGQPAAGAGGAELIPRGAEECTETLPERAGNARIADLPLLGARIARSHAVDRHDAALHAVDRPDLPCPLEERLGEAAPRIG